MPESKVDRESREAEESRTVTRPPNAEELRKGTRTPVEKENKSWSVYESDLKNTVSEAIDAQEERLKILAPKGEEGKPAPKIDPRMLKVEEGFVRKTIKRVLDNELQNQLIDSIAYHFRSRVNPNPAPDSVTARGSTADPHPERSRTPLSPQPVASLATAGRSQAANVEHKRVPLPASTPR